MKAASAGSCPVEVERALLVRLGRYFAAVARLQEKLAAASRGIPDLARTSQLLAQAARAWEGKIKGLAKGVAR